MKTHIIFVVIGIVFLILATIVSLLFSHLFVSELYIKNTIINDAIIESKKYLIFSKSINEKKPVSIVINSIPESSLVHVDWYDPNGNVIQKYNFSKEINRTLTPPVLGAYSVNITNSSSNPISTSLFFGY